MAMPFIEDLAKSLQGNAPPYEREIELLVGDGKIHHEAFLKVWETPQGFRTSLEVWRGSVANVVNFSVTTDDLEEIATLFTEAADVSRSLS